MAFDAKFRRLPDTVFVRSSIGQAATRTVSTPRGGTVPVTCDDHADDDQNDAEYDVS